MSDALSERPRTATRMRFVAPPGMELEERKDVKTIGRYEILETLGKGAMGVVYKARDPLLDRIVAVKTIVSPRGSGRRTQRAYLERFEREAKAAAKMQHPAIVTIFDVGTEDGSPFMVLEYLPGDSLADRLDSVRMPLAKGISTALDLASALGFAHNERIVHRDVKPANVLNAGQNRWKLADFGIARMPDSDLTQVGIFMGTPGYAPPEAISQGRYTPQADVFAWGAVLYELMSGRIPYEGPDTRTTNGYVLKKTARSPREHDPSIPQILADVCMTALHPSIEVRYKDGNSAEAALRSAWERCINEEMVGPKAFSNKDVPHDQAPAMMHATATTAHDRTEREVRLPEHETRIPDLRTQEADALIIEASTMVGDNDPTRIMGREGSEPQTVEAVRRSELRRKDASRPRALDPDDANLAILAKAKATAAQSDESAILAKARAAAQSTESGLSVKSEGQSPALGLWLGVVFALLVAGALGAYYLLNYL